MKLTRKFRWQNVSAFGNLFVSPCGTDDKGDPWFNAVDVCKVLGYSNGRDALCKHVDEADVAKCDTRSGGQRRKVNFVNESGLYALVLGSKLPNAREFKRWVTSEVLPSLRKHGAYLTPEALRRTLADPGFAARLFVHATEGDHR